MAAAYDWQVHLEGLSPLQALEVLHTGAAYDYDPEVVASCVVCSRAVGCSARFGSNRARSCWPTPAGRGRHA